MSRKNCPLESDCLKKNVMYQATVKVVNIPAIVYIRATEKVWMQRFQNHNTSFKKR